MTNPNPKEALEELLEVADKRGDSTLPHPADDPLPWTARMQDAWEEAEAAIPVAELEGQAMKLLENRPIVSHEVILWWKEINKLLAKREALK